MAVTVSDLRARLATDLDDAVLQRILAAAEEAVIQHAGPADAVTEHHSALGAPAIASSRPMASITSVKERQGLTADQVTLAADDYRQLGPYKLLRLPGGTNSASHWGSEVEVVYAPEADESTRDRVTLDLAMMDAEFVAADASEAGASKTDQKDFAKRRRALLWQIKEGRSPVA